jgi:Rps23 Pro-64 3,4-dihydroxylase Tpa1-like proline 4-hydroxylase
MSDVVGTPKPKVFGRNPQCGWSEGSVSFLPVARLREVAPSAAQQYRTARPFPHVVLDGLFDPDLLTGIIKEFPRPSDIKWIQYRNKREVKLASGRDEHFGPLTKGLLYHLNSSPFLDWLSQITGIENLMADSYFEGGGMHQIERGGKLAIHADFNHHPRYNVDRRLNALLYLNSDWQEEYGGHLELWDREMTGCVARIAPLFNRLVVFATTDFSYHGHPDRLTCPEGVTRKSLALYYYTNGRPAEEISGDHSTLWRARSGNLEDQDLEQEQPRLRVKDLVKDLLPPVVTRLIVAGKRAARQRRL